MDRTTVGDRKELRTLVFGELSLKGDVTFDDGKRGLLGLAGGTVFGVDSRVPKANGDARERPPSFRAYIPTVIEVQEPSAASKKSYGVWPLSLPPAEAGSSLPQTMRAGRDLLSKSIIAPHSHHAFGRLD